MRKLSWIVAVLTFAMIAVILPCQLSAQTVLYNNGPINGAVGAATINGGYEITDSFVISSTSTVTQVSDIGLWVFFGGLSRQPGHTGRTELGHLHFAEWRRDRGGQRVGREFVLQASSGPSTTSTLRLLRQLFGATAWSSRRARTIWNWTTPYRQTRSPSVGTKTSVYPRPTKAVPERGTE